MERDVEHVRVEAVRQEYLARMRTFTTSCWHSFNFDQILEERRIFLSLKETDVERQEEKLVEEQA
jgi:hypothetical protein